MRAHGRDITGELDRGWTEYIERELDRRWQSYSRARRLRLATAWVISGLIFLGWLAYLVLSN